MNSAQMKIAVHGKTTHLGREAAKKCVPEVHKRKSEVLIEEVAQKLAHAQV